MTSITNFDVKNRAVAVPFAFAFAVSASCAAMTVAKKLHHHCPSPFVFCHNGVDGTNDQLTSIILPSTKKTA